MLILGYEVNHFHDIILFRTKFTDFCYMHAYICFIKNHITVISIKKCYMWNQYKVEAVQSPFYDLVDCYYISPTKIKF